MMALLKKDTKFHWTEECEASFQELKKRLTIAPVLILQIYARISKCIATLLVGDLEAFLCKKEESFHMTHDSFDLTS